MSAAAPLSLLARLPGYDTAPDIYETPAPSIAPTDETHRTLRDQSPDATGIASDTSATSDEEHGSDSDGSSAESDPTAVGVSRRRLHPQRARGRFAAGAGRVHVGRADLSDRVDGRRKGYGLHRHEEGVEQQGEGLEARIARLRREIEDCRIEAAREDETEAGGEKDGASQIGEDIQGLSQMMGLLETTRPRSKVATGFGGSTDTVPVPAIAEAEDNSVQGTLARVADFDGRLAVLERALGLSTLENVGGGGGPMPAAMSLPLLPTLTLLDQQMSVLSSASSLANLDAMGTRIRTLRREADDLAAAASAPASDQTSGEAAKRRDGETDQPVGQESDAALTAEDIGGLHTLYSLIPTLQSLSPTVPALLTRLHSLRTLHASAAQASNELDDVEQRQSLMDTELEAWREGLRKMETAVHEAAEANGRNGKVVEGWVREMEARVKALGR